MITDILIALVIGMVAGAIDILPMLKKGIPKFSILFIFSQWVLIGLLIPFVNWDMAPWLKGMIIAELGMVPVMILTYGRNRKKIPTIIIYAAILGIGIGIAGASLIGGFSLQGVRF